MVSKFFCFSYKKKSEDQFFFSRGVNREFNNQPCPDCGRISRRIVLKYDNEKRDKNGNSLSWFQGCLECFPVMKYVPFCDRICHKCFDEKNWDLLKQKEQPKTLLWAISSTAVISLIIGLFLGWLFFKKLQKKS